jgi:hypothetical protein
MYSHEVSFLITINVFILFKTSYFPAHNSVNFENHAQVDTLVIFSLISVSGITS